MRNVSRCWAYETGLAAGVELGEGKLRMIVNRVRPSLVILSLFPDIPMNEYFEYFGPYYKLDVKQSNMEDMNTREYLERMKSRVLENLRYVRGPPSVQMQGKSGDCINSMQRLTGRDGCPTEVPRLPHDDEDPNEDEDMVDPDERRSRVSLEPRLEENCA